MADPEEQATRVTRSGEYVLGTLDDDERERFIRELANDPQACRERAYWEQRLGAIGLSLAPVQPPEHVWQAISERTFDAGAASTSQTAPQAESPRASRTEPGAWRALAIAASVAALVMAAMLLTGVSSDESDRGDAGYGRDTPTYASMVYDAPTGTSWLVTAGNDGDAMSVTAMGGYDVPDGKVLRAWLVPAEGKPVPLGEWPHTPGVHQLPVSKTAADYMAKRASLMVSMEDADDNDYAAPAGRLMWTSPIARRTG